MLGLSRRNHPTRFPRLGHGHSLRTIRHAPKRLAQILGGGRRDFASGAPRAIARPAKWAILGAYRQDWASYDVLFAASRSGSSALRSLRHENVLFKIAFPAEFQRKTAVKLRSSCTPRSRTGSRS